MATLHIMNGPTKGRQVEVTKPEIQLGRAEENDVVLNDPSVSSRHARITRTGQRYMFDDLGSTNGSRLNGEPVNRTQLAPRDIIALGSIEILFDGEDVDVPDREPRSETVERTQVLPVSASAATRTESPFGAKRDARKLWTVVIVLIVLVVLGLGGWFVHALLQQGAAG